MFDDSEWVKIRDAGSEYIGGAGMGVLRITLLFGSAAVALALIVAPIMDRQTRPLYAGGSLPATVDRIVTGSVPQPRRYTIRRSVLHSSPSAVCVIRDDGSRSGDCR